MGRGIQEGLKAVQESPSGVFVEGVHCLCDELAVEHIGVRPQPFEPGAGQPDQCAPAVVGVGLALEQAMALELSDDLADHRLCAIQVQGSLADRNRSGLGQVLEDGAGGVGQLAAPSVPAVERKVGGGEGLTEGVGCGHGSMLGVD